MFFKRNVVYRGVSWEIGYALGVADQIYADNGEKLIVTALLDGVHNPGSLHPLGLAADLRTRDLAPATRQHIFDTLRSRLYPLGFDVVWEGGTASSPLSPAATAPHIHIEYQPKDDRPSAILARYEATSERGTEAQPV